MYYIIYIYIYIYIYAYTYVCIYIYIYIYIIICHSCNFKRGSSLSSLLKFKIAKTKHIETWMVKLV